MTTITDLGEQVTSVLEGGHRLLGAAGLTQRGREVVPRLRFATTVTELGVQGTSILQAAGGLLELLELVECQTKTAPRPGLVVTVADLLKSRPVRSCER
jgi:hypothetical protein